MHIRIQLSETDLKRLVANEISRTTGTEIDSKKIVIETKSTQNYRAEWEVAAFRAIYEVGAS